MNRAGAKAPTDDRQGSVASDEALQASRHEQKGQREADSIDIHRRDEGKQANHEGTASGKTSRADHRLFTQEPP